ncbi:ubiquitin carboxyl-terminal hydrolase 10 isoform X2 [Chrysoperla carnea]|uniref:ubiquitin carboxyl-terminal hydrolase 10 isoform X2 n=1 Tax=Chrysoperla carnea TaxID=189513 RepID=UPI001D073ADF|nr:ubiquitin carboxyl-terminal hydrolase 10 isoform X2 [Chrysoperla carnea]
MDSTKSEGYEFLDLSDVDDSERNHLKEIFGNPQLDYTLQLPWVSDQSVSSNNSQYSEPVGDYSSQQWLQHPNIQQSQYGVPMPHSGMLHTPFYPVVIQPYPVEDGFYYIAEEFSMTESPIPGDSDQHSGRDSPSISGVSTGGSSGVMSPHSGVGGAVHSPHVYGPQHQHPPPPPNVYSIPAAPAVQPGYPQQNVYVNNVTAHVNYHSISPQYIPGFAPPPPTAVPPPPTAAPPPPAATEQEIRTNGNGGRQMRSRNISRHRQTEVDPSPPMNPPMFKTLIMPQPQPYATYYSPPAAMHHPSAQLATGVYPPHGMYVPAGPMPVPEFPYSTDAQGVHHPVQEAIPVDPQRENAQPYQNPMPGGTTIIVSNQQPSKQKQNTNKSSCINTHVQIKHETNEKHHDTKSEVVVITPVPEVSATTIVTKSPIITSGGDMVKKSEKIHKTKTSPKVVNTTPKVPVTVAANNGKPSTPVVEKKIEKPQKDVQNIASINKESKPVVNNPPKSVSTTQPVPATQLVAAPIPVTQPVSIEKTAIKPSEQKTIPKSIEKPKIQIPEGDTTLKENVIAASPKEICAVFNKAMSIKEEAVGEKKNLVNGITPKIIESSPSVTNNNSTQKSWASLFNKSANNNSVSSPVINNTANSNTINSSNTATAANTPKVVNKPLARVLPFDSQADKKVGNKDLKNNQTKPQKAVGSAFFDDPNSYRMGEFLSKYVIDNRTISLLPRGLTNRSNFCYVNSILQALLACPPFYNLIQALPQQKSLKEKSPYPIIDSIIDLINEFSPLPAGARVGRREKNNAAATANQKGEVLEFVNCGPALEPSSVYQSLNMIRSDSFSVDGRQEDAEEFLGCLLNSLNDEMVELIKLVEDNMAESSPADGKKSGNSGDISDEDEWKVMGPKNKGSITRRTEFSRSPVSDIFRGQLRSRVQRAGDQSTDNVQPFFTLQLDIEKATSVKEALEILVGKDRLEGVTCSRTQQAVEAWQQVSIEELPLVLILHLKCFHYERDTCSKIIKNVEFPVDLKIDSKLMSANKKYTNKQKQYKLFAVVYHDGKEATKGHYITDAFHVGYGGWVRYDDSSVRGVSESQVLRPRAPRMPYLLYYRRCDTIGNQGAQQPQTKKE